MGTALDGFVAADPKNLNLLKTMAKRFGAFDEMLRNVRLGMAKADELICQNVTARLMHDDAEVQALRIAKAAR